MPCPSLFLLLICHLALLQLDSVFFQTLFLNAILRPLMHSSEAHSRAHTPPPSPLRHLKTKEWRDVSFTTKVETHPHRHLLLPLLLFRHGVNTNEEEMSPLLCPHLSRWPRDTHTHPCLSHSPVSHLLCHHL